MRACLHRAGLWLGVLTSLATIAPASALAQSTENVLLVINETSADSIRIGEYYAKVRALPGANVVRLKMPVDEAAVPAELTDRLMLTLANESVATLREGIVADADLVGYPVHVVVGSRGLESGTVDLKLRATGERTKAPLAEASQAIADLLSSAP